jgi:hypothetical protein
VVVLNYLRDDLKDEAATAVMATWLTLRVMGRWKSEPTWDDRLGRFVGVSWVALYLGSQLLALVP